MVSGFVSQKIRDTVFEISRKLTEKFADRENNSGALYCNLTPKEVEVLNLLAKQSESPKDRKMERNRCTEPRILTLKVVVPRNLKSSSSGSLKLMLVSIQNSIAVCSVYMYRIERELKKRGRSKHLLRENDDVGDIIEFARLQD